MRSPTLVRYGEGLIAHGQRDCPEDYGAVHPMIQRDTWRAWQWYGGGLIDRWIHYAHRLPGLRQLVCAVWCARYERYRGPWAPLVRDTFPIPWPRSLHPERQARYARFEARDPIQDPD